MTEAQLEIDSRGRLRVSGELSMATVPGLVDQAQWDRLSGDPIEVDLQGVNRADSAGVALLIEWQRAAAQRQQRLRFENIPAQMRSIAHLSGVDELLSIN
ncbi:MAG TPA: STAS domain-containing protein [Gammaproteobacteria bacterium]|nr:STAS domain-containing protein [Gammaproteobacteria bacterium]